MTFKVGHHKLVSQKVDRKSQLLNDHRQIWFQLLPFYEYPLEGSQWCRNKDGGLKNDLCFLPFKEFPHEGIQYRRFRIKRFVAYANKNVKSVRTFENLPEHFVRSSPQELLEEICQITKGNYRPDWHEYLVKTSGGSPSLDIFNVKEGRTLSLEEIERLKLLFHEPKEIRDEQLDQILSPDSYHQSDVEVPTMELKDLTDRRFEYEELGTVHQHSLVENEEFEDVCKTQMVFKLPKGRYFKFGVSTLDTGANLNLLDVSSLERLGGTMNDIDTGVSAVIRNSSTELGKEVLGTIVLELNMVDHKRQQIICLGEHEFFVINTGMEDVLVGTKSLKKMQCQISYHPELKITLAGLDQNEKLCRVTASQYEAEFVIENSQSILVNQSGDRVIDMVMCGNSHQPQYVQDATERWIIPHQPIPSIHDGESSKIQYSDVIHHWKMSIKFLTGGLYKPGDVKILCQGASQDTTGVSFVSRGFYGHEVLDKGVDELASMTLSSQELLDPTKIDLKHLDSGVERRLRKLINQYDEIFTKEGSMVGCFKLKKFKLDFKGKFKSANYALKLSTEQQHCLDKEIAELEKNNIVVECEDNGNPHLAIFAVGKNKNKMSIASKLEKQGPIDYSAWRLVLDARPINQVTVGVGYLELPRSEEVVSRIADSLVSIIDIKGAYWSLLMEEETSDWFRFRHQGRVMKFTRAVMGAQQSSVWLAEALGMTLSQQMFNQF